MAAIVSTRIIRLQAISPRTTTVSLPPGISAPSVSSTPGTTGTPTTDQIALYWNATTLQFEIWRNGEFKLAISGTIQYAISIPTLSLNLIIPVISVATTNVFTAPTTATPPNQSLNSLIPGISVNVTSP